MGAQQAAEWPCAERSSRGLGGADLRCQVERAIGAHRVPDEPRTSFEVSALQGKACPSSDRTRGRQSCRSPRLELEQAFVRNAEQ
jgi:hypothetical protein